VKYNFAQNFSKRELLTLSIPVCTLVGFFVNSFEFHSEIPDYFYDADSPRTLNYVVDPRSAISSIRPALFLVSLLAHFLNFFVTPYFAWSIINLFAAVSLGIFLGSRFRERQGFLPIFFLLATNFSLIVWVLVPDTFLIAMAFFMVGIVIYQDGTNRRRVILGGIVAVSMNLFLLLPWTLSQLFLGKQKFRQNIGNLAIVIGTISSLSIVTQYCQKFKTQFTISPSAYVRSLEEVRSYLPFYHQPGVLSKFDVFGWIHVPWIGFVDNSISFFAAPWTPTYKYVSGNWAIDSIYFPKYFLFTSICLTFFSYAGINRLRLQNRSLYNYLISLEFSCYFLFITYGTHPFLFSPLLFLSRLYGILNLINQRRLYLYIYLAISITFTFFILDLLK